MSRQPNTITKVHERMEDELRHILRTTRIDLDGFLALDADARGARWRVLQANDRADLVRQQLTRTYGGWDDEGIAYWVARYNTKWGAAPTDTETLIDGWLDDAAADAQRRADDATSSDEATYHLHEARMYRTALARWRSGVRPVQQPGGVWHVASSSSGTTYTITRDGSCSCPWRSHHPQSLCHHAALVLAVEGVADQRDATDDTDLDAVYIAAAADLGRRCAVARMRYLAEVA